MSFLRWRKSPKARRECPCQHVHQGPTGLLEGDLVEAHLTVHSLLEEGKCEGMTAPAIADELVRVSQQFGQPIALEDARRVVEDELRERFPVAATG